MEKVGERIDDFKQSMENVQFKNTFRFFGDNI
jgi:hypothetical protein